MPQGIKRVKQPKRAKQPPQQTHTHSHNLFKPPSMIKFVTEAEDSLRVKGNVFKRCDDSRLKFEYIHGCPFCNKALKNDSNKITVLPANGMIEVAVNMLCEGCASLVHILWSVEDDPVDEPSTIEEVLDEEDGEYTPSPKPEPIDKDWRRVVAQKISNEMINLEISNSRFVKVTNDRGDPQSFF